MRGKKSVDQSGSAGKVAPVPHTEKRRLLTPASSAPRIAAQQQAPPLPNESVGPYIILKTLGTGGFSHVKLAVHIRDGKRVALKMLEKPRSVKQGQANGHGPESEQLQTAIDQAHREAALIESLKHPHIIRLLTTFETETHSCLVLEYIPNSDLYELMTAHPASLTEAFIKRIFSEMCSAVAHLHRNNICHRDIKIENILVDSDTGVKLTDFGLATRFTPGVLLTDRCGSEEYVAPEVIKALPYDGRKTDVWALGIILFALLTGELPFNVRPGSTLRSMFHRIATGSYKFPPPQPGRPPVSDLAKDLIRKILTTNPVKRPSVEEVLSHPWLAQTVTGR
ncbi:kinase-like domain-containing protein [Fimicolochytrium jonesii]|uniref:kinase-like domain-containing protein n=1 Tax=Fimicolochytrium jonesii TaxID=1396493 RepID=UPI0022FE9D6E|nr:kinase-like domain-containing protein [Fimicolochytrium jonesii]KAI8824266.1 kinase-like domain-containing protein [Fimicolochytrium jonesii]